jgi:hypothetical protein
MVLGEDARHCNEVTTMAKATKATKAVWPDPAKVDSRISFGINYYTSKADADAVGKAVSARGDTRNGGFFHGTPLGRDASWDYVDPTLGPLFAVTTR